MQPRVSQRPSLACRECTRRKRKCDKKIPCSRCVRLSLQCDREVIYLRRHISQNGSEIAFLTSLREELQSPNPSKVAKAVQKITERIGLLHSGQAKESPSRSDVGCDILQELPSPDKKAQSELSDVPDSQAEPQIDPDGQDSLIVTALEQIAWGRNYGNCYPHRRCACHHNRSWSELSSIDSQSFQFARSPFAATLNLPHRDLANVLISFHTDNVAWHHNCLHSPTFLQQCNIFWNTGECDQLQWIALYCSVLATSLFCLQHSPKYHDKYGYALGSVPYSAQELFKTMLDILYESNFLQNLSLYSVQAIVISTEVAHNLGHSQLNATLFSAAIRIAECLGVHKIGDPKPDILASDVPLPREEWYAMLEREVGRRVWLQMVIQDHFAIPFTDSYGIYPAQYSTKIPSNANDANLKAMPDNIPTVSTYTRVLSSIADLMPELADGMGPLKERKSVRRQYEHVLAMDQKMRHVVRAIPQFLLQANPLLEAQIPWLGIARQSLAVTAAEKIIMIHRPFMFRSFQSPAYAPTRRTCVSASMTILRNHRSITESGEVSLWTHTAFCITAALILCFEIICNRGEDHADDLHSQRAMYGNAIDHARQYLTSRTGDVLAQRGVLLINAIFSGVPGEAQAPASISFADVVSRFTLDWAILGLNSEIQQQSAESPVDLRPTLRGSPSVHGAGFSPEFEDFDAWFQHIFSTGAEAFE
ncbi:c6 zinc finger domain containing protein [Grosmannia clavigera kw1407]|uniref:C6 zinc finger domain containing protein n=1 Tax=Grosmannia clavigera (strain kw1407 / UAMH 11150) TaxID=655863 RepID=F0XSV2_GROCL|nr:c6 zinc finger domain containing protein [Grosmannia clavigera kw1407]EFW99065.1 c6 zinc finger domain containing protein [Grosmannia clavigera kw1407]